MKLRGWIILWCAIAAFCVAVGIGTRASYSALSPNQDVVLNSYYGYSDAGKATADFDALSKQAELIATCRFEGDRSLANACMVSKVQVAGVLKGDQSLKGTSIPVYEPVNVSRNPIVYFKIGKNYAQLAKLFHWQGKTHVVVSQPNGGSAFSSYTPMASGKTYLLFLNPDQNIPERRWDGKYALADSIFAKIEVDSGNVAAYKPPKSYLSFREAMQYEILLTDPSHINAYFDGKAKILGRLKLL